VPAEVTTVSIEELYAWADSLEKAEWTTAYVNDLPDSAFLLIVPGGAKDRTGRTVPRSLRKLPIRGKDGELDWPHVRNAIQRVPRMVDVSDAQKEALQKKLRKMLPGRQEGEKSMASDLDRWADQVLSKAGAPKPPAGYSAIPGGQHGGYRKKAGKGWVYWYPDREARFQAKTSHLEAGNREEAELAAHADAPYERKARGDASFDRAVQIQEEFAQAARNGDTRRMGKYIKEVEAQHKKTAATQEGKPHHDTVGEHLEEMKEALADVKAAKRKHGEGFTRKHGQDAHGDMTHGIEEGEHIRGGWDSPFAEAYEDSTNKHKRAQSKTGKPKKEKPDYSIPGWKEPSQEEKAELEKEATKINEQVKAEHGVRLSYLNNVSIQKLYDHDKGGWQTPKGDKAALEEKARAFAEKYDQMYGRREPIKWRVNFETGESAPMTTYGTVDRKEKSKKAHPQANLVKAFPYCSTPVPGSVYDPYCGYWPVTYGVPRED